MTRAERKTVMIAEILRRGGGNTFALGWPLKKLSRLGDVVKLDDALRKRMAKARFTMQGEREVWKWELPFTRDPDEAFVEMLSKEGVATLDRLPILK